MNPPFLKSDWPGHEVRRGKVRDVYDLDDRLLFIATDRISAFDWVLPSGIPDKGRVLAGLSEHWFAWSGVPHHLLSTDLSQAGFSSDFDTAALAGRSQIVRKTSVFPVECVVRGYLAGSGWKEYRQTGTVCGIPLPKGLRECDRLPEPIFTPATKAETGHDENIDFATMVGIVGQKFADELRRRTVDLYLKASEYARERGIIIADTKFEFGRIGDEILLIDEVLTPDSSRFWPADQYEPGKSQPSYDKQFVRDWLESTPWDKNSPPPELPADVVTRTRQKYVEAFELLTGKAFAWK